MYPIHAPSALPMSHVEMEFQRSKSTIETSTTARASANISRVGIEGRSLLLTIPQCRSRRAEFASFLEAFTLEQRHFNPNWICKLTFREEM
jgi:hypothetical protein